MELTLSLGATTVPCSTLARDPRISTTANKQVSNERRVRGGEMGVRKLGSAEREGRIVTYSIGDNAIPLSMSIKNRIARVEYEYSDQGHPPLFGSCQATFVQRHSTGVSK